MSIHNTLPILFTIVISLLFSSHGLAHASEQGVSPSVQKKVDDAAYDSSAVEKIWNFENYTFSFTLPEAMEGYFYPNPHMIHGVGFPLGPQKKPEEHRDLLIWAHYNALEHNEANLKKDHKSNVEWLAKLDASVAHKKWRTFEETHGGFRFFCAELRGDSIMSSACTARRQAGMQIMQSLSMPWLHLNCMSRWGINSEEVLSGIFPRPKVQHTRVRVYGCPLSPFAFHKASKKKALYMRSLWQSDNSIHCTAQSCFGLTKAKKLMRV